LEYITKTSLSLNYSKLSYFVVAKTLRETSHTERLQALLLLKDNKPFLLEDRYRKLQIASKSEPAMNIPANSIENFIFFFNNYVFYDFGLPYYALSSQGRRLFQQEFDKYSPKVKKDFKNAARLVWGKSLDRKL